MQYHHLSWYLPDGRLTWLAAWQFGLLPNLDGVKLGQRPKPFEVADSACGECLHMHLMQSQACLWQQEEPALYTSGRSWTHPRHHEM